MQSKKMFLMLINSCLSIFMSVIDCTYQACKHAVIHFIVNSVCVQVGQYVHALKMGWMKPTPKEEDKEEEDAPNYYMLWKEDEEVRF